jgi:hypothetical protein
MIEANYGDSLPSLPLSLPLLSVPIDFSYCPPIVALEDRTVGSEPIVVVVELHQEEIDIGRFLNCLKIKIITFMN